VDTDTCLGAATQSTARILIHAGSDVGASGSKSPLQWLRALCSAGASPGERASLRLQIEDLRGRQVLALEDGGPLVVVALPAGTYHVNAQLGNLRRWYTMTLKEGASLDVYLNLAPVPQ
jgi:hypothetical protein